MRKLTILRILLTLSLVGIVVSSPKSNTSGARKEAKDRFQPRGPIDGAQNPELIPDHVAYSILFRLLSKHHTDAENKSTRAYIRVMGLGKQNCKDCQSVGTDDADIDALIAIADEYEQRIGVLDRQASELRERGGLQPNPVIAKQLAYLEEQHEALINETIAALPARLSREAVDRVAKHVNERMKRKMKIVPGPLMPPDAQHIQH